MEQEKIFEIGYYVDDHCDGSIYPALLHGKSGQSYNISGNNELE